MKGIPVYNVALPLLRRTFSNQSPITKVITVEVKEEQTV